MKVIRSGVFETNSSSTHSICITKNNILDDKQDFIKFTIGEFGWEHKKYTTPYKKAQYLYTAILDNKRYDLIYKIKTILDSHNIKYEFEEPKFHTSSDGKYKYLPYEYIDHSDELDDFLEICEDEDKLMKFLFSSESFIITGNDNDGYNMDINVNYPHDEYYKGN